jgi:hypothetical protein
MTWTMMLLSMLLSITPAAAADPTECKLADCLPAVEMFPPAPCQGQAIPRDVRRRVRQVRVAVQGEADTEDRLVPKPARAVIKWLRRATRETKEAVAEGKITGECADVLQGFLRNARACASCPALRELPPDRRELEAS